MTGDRPTSRRRFLAGLGSALAGAVGLAGCGYVPGGGDVRWTTGYSDSYTDRVAATGDTIYAMTRSQRGYDFDAEQWTETAEVRAVRGSDGTERWTEQYDSPATAFGVGAGAVALWAGQTVARLGGDGEVWRASVPVSPTTLAVTDDRVYGVTDDGAVFACADGDVQWQQRDSRLHSDARFDAGPDGVVAVSDDSGGAGDGTTGSVVGLAPDGSERWRRSELGGADRVVVQSGTAYVVDGDGITAVAATSGETQWTNRSGRSYRVTDQGVFRLDIGTFVALDGSGDVRWSFEHDDRAEVETRTDVAADGRGVFVETEDGLTALAAGDGHHRWTVRYEYVEDGPFLVESGVVVATLGDLVCHVP